ncbi:MAG: 2-amino-4-hydroxy-6-hydroxymethyldihydropteridine diphosphokinase [Alphaproteobacteria bacterium]|nr:2-amino-4-hydroxy-6-hydroxymethyldihydropteridine diphosphokinase [Alphaproteobacteria bacterium]MBL6937770.1 2-amino-4-hydroxy-6-hydroxymethyldihydropteridine diphosphokinase [Alphaproteobacteria bacterium]MBL7099404.1 2-amino-4-hydroxy-6-hydroxymethyldihydropteridine diphosphokinase [Alphaproteobacteria bacterium]
MILIALGSNLASAAGTPAQTLTAAIAHLPQHEMSVAAISPYYVTPAWPDPNDPSFVNAVAQIDTRHSPETLMEALHATEAAFGRVRSVMNAPRTLDLDLLDFNGRVMQGPPVLPHPRLAERAFVLVPLADIAPHWRDPRTGRAVSELLAALPAAERAAVRPISSG